MQRITPFESESWVYVNEVMAKDKSIKQLRADVRRRVFQSNAWLFDLDETHAVSPGKLIARKAIGTRHYSPSYLAWCAKTFYNWAMREPGVEGKRWAAYVDSFLREQEALDETVRMFDKEMVRKSLYPGVEDFCSLVSDARRFYVTKNIFEVARAYADFLGFNGFYYEAANKADIVEQFFARDRPHLRFYGVEGDSGEDEEMLAVLRFYGKDTFGIVCSKEPVDLDSTTFDINISRDHSGLVKILTQ